MSVKINCPLNELRQKAYTLKSSIDSSAKMDKSEIKMYSEFMNIGLECPTRYALLKRCCFNSNSINYPGTFVRNMKFIHKNPEIIALEENINDLFETNYPKTKFIRKYIINKEHINPACITERKGFNYFAKLEIYSNKFFAKIFHKKFKL